MNNIKTMKLALEALEYFSDTATLNMDKAFSEDAITALRQAIEQAQQAEPVALKKGECWPESVMQMWDYYRKQIANGHTGSEPRDWFESLAEMRLVDTSPPPRQPLTDEEIRKANHHRVDGAYDYSFKQGVRYAEAAHGIGEKA